MAKEEQITAQAAIDRYADMVYRLALSQMKNTTDADDLFQEVFVRLVRHVQDLETWEQRVADTEEIYQPPEEHPVREAVQKLPPKYRLVIHLYYYEEFSVAEIARLTEQKESTVKSQMHRAREMLKQILETGK